MTINRILLFCSFMLSLYLMGCGPAEDPHAGHDHGAPAAATGSSALSPQALASLGLEVAPIQKQDFVRYETVQATAVLPPLSSQPLSAPVSGRVKTVHRELGTMVQTDQTVVSLVRDPLPRVQLTLTEELLKPASEEFHETAVSLRKAAAELEIVQTELTRLDKLNAQSAGALVPRQQLIELQYEEARAKKDLELLKARLMLHGLDEKDIQGLLNDQAIEHRESRWQASLAANGLWNTRAQKLYEALSEEARDLPWSVAGIGELGALGLLTPGLTDWIKSTPEASEHFITIAGMLQAGHSLEDVKALQAASAFAPTAQLKAPASTSGWDIQAIHARPGERVDAGTPLVTLVDPSKLMLKIQPAGRELALLRKVIQTGQTVAARPLIKDAGLSYEGLAITHIQSEGEELHPVAYLSITNQVLQMKDAHRSWAVQPGTRYTVELPIELWEKVWVLPAEAVTEDGAESVVFIENGDSFSPAKVSVLFQDERVAVLGPESDIYPGDPVVLRNAFGLALALNSGGGAEVDPHAGHSH